MLIIGLTGGIASGKNFIADIFKKRGAAIFDADLEVHNLFSKDKKIITKLTKEFPQSLDNKGFISRDILRQIILKEPEKIKILEKIIHPEIRNLEVKFLKKARYQKKKIAILNIPLLFESENLKPIFKRKIVNFVSKNKTIRYKISCAKNDFKNYRRFDFTVSVIVNKEIQKQRFLRRNLKNNDKKGEEFLKKITKNQITNLQRKKYSDFVIHNGLDKGKSLKQVNSLIAQLSCATHDHHKLAL